MDDLGSKPRGVSRRGLLGGAAVAGAAGAALGAAEAAGAAAPEQARAAAVRDPARAGAAEFQAPDTAAALTLDRSGSDFMVDVLKALGVRYVAANPGSTFRGLHESVVNYGGEAGPELITCLHEETSVAMAVGYALATGKPLAVFLHSNVGLQHASMSIYHAFADRVPVLMFAGNLIDADERRPLIEWLHASQDNGALVRDFVKWDDQPVSLAHFAESTVRAYDQAVSVPAGPVLISVDAKLQEEATTVGAEAIPRLNASLPPVGDLGAVRAVADQLCAAEAPVILADRYARTEAGMGLLVQLAELLGAPVIDAGGRNNFPTDHPLNLSFDRPRVVARADVILALEPVDLWGVLHRQTDQLAKTTRSAVSDKVKVLTLGTSDLGLHSNLQSFQRYVGVDASIVGDAEASLPVLIAAIQAGRTPAMKAAWAKRATALAEQSATIRTRDRAAARAGWGDSPVTTGRLCAELWEAIKDEDWVLTSSTFFVSMWPERLWKIDKPHQHICSLGAGGIGVGIGVAAGVALACKAQGRIAVNIQGDGDLLYAPGALWTAAHHRLPLLTVMHNNRAYHQELMHIQRMALRHQRDVGRSVIGTTLTDPSIDYAKLAEGMGVWAEGPVTSPDKLAPALRRAVAVVKSGRPALVDVHTEPR